MATISKFYLHDAATPNTGTMPGAGNAFIVVGASGDTTGDATGARTARAANDTIGVLETSSLITANADTTGQSWGHRRFVSAPLAAVTFAAADGNWTLSDASVESNANHNGTIDLVIYLWRPGTGARLGTISVHPTHTVTTTKTARTATAAWSGTQAILDGDILVFEISDEFIQSMGTAYTSNFYYDGTTEASTTSCASFVTPPAALTLFTAAASPSPPAHPFQPIPFVT